jgi:hypothetical protein
VDSVFMLILFPMVREHYAIRRTLAWPFARCVMKAL